MRNRTKKDSPARAVPLGHQGVVLAPGQSTVVEGERFVPPVAETTRPTELSLRLALNSLSPNRQTRHGEVESPIRAAFASWAKSQGHNSATLPRWRELWAEFARKEV